MMRALAVLLAVSSSSTAFAKPLPEEPSVTVTRVARAIRAHDAKALAKLMHANVLVRGMWFPDAACTKRFGKQRMLKKREHAAFAQCLTKLELGSSTRKSSSEFAQLVTYQPGIEIELAFADGQLYYAGYVHAKPSATPSLTAPSFEALRKTGTTNVDARVAAKLDPEVAKHGRTQVAAWLDVCLDEKGAATITVAEATTKEIGAVFLAATSDWTFDPHVITTAAVVCSQSLLTYPAASAPTMELLPRSEVPHVGEVDGEGVLGGVVGDGVEWVPGVGYPNTLTVRPPPPPPPPPRN